MYNSYIINRSWFSRHKLFRCICPIFYFILTNPPPTTIPGISLEQIQFTFSLTGRVKWNNTFIINWFSRHKLFRCICPIFYFILTNPPPTTIPGISLEQIQFTFSLTGRVKWNNTFIINWFSRHKLFQIYQDFIRFFSLYSKLSVFVNNFLCPIWKCSGNFSAFGGNDVDMFYTLIES